MEENENKMKVNGVIVPCITFFNKNHEIYRELNSLLIQHVILNGADSIFIFGNTGEGVYFYDNIKEKRKYLDLTFEQTSDKFPVLLGVFGNKIDEVIDQLEIFAKDYTSLNFIIAPPFTHKLDKSQIKEYLENIINSVSFKNHIYLYNNPNTFGANNIDDEILKELLKNPNLKGIKDTTSDINNVKSFLKYLSDDFRVYCGEEKNYAAFLKMIPLELRKHTGLVPSISNISNICSAMFQKALKGEDSQLDNLQEELNRQQKIIYDIRVPRGQEPRGLKHSFYFIYENTINVSEDDATIVSSALERKIEKEIKDRQRINLKNLLESKTVQKISKEKK